MAITAGVGFSNHRDAEQAGIRAVSDAIARGCITDPTVVLAFCGSQTDPLAFFAGIRSVIGEASPIVGGSAIGIITNDSLSYTGNPCGAAVLQFEGERFTLGRSYDLNSGERDAGKRLGQCFADESPGKAFLAFYDSVRRPPTVDSPPVLNASTPFLDGLQETLPSIPIIGAGLLGDFGFSPTWQFGGHLVGRQSAVGLMLDGGFDVYCRIMHGCAPLDGVYRTITSIQDNIVYSLDNRPVVKLIDDLYGNREWRRECPVSLVALGINHGSRLTHPQEENYVNRLIVGVLPNDDGIALFEPDLAVGDEIQFMLRDSTTMIDSAVRNTTDLMDQITREGKRGVWGFYIDCAGRTAQESHADREEAAEVQRVLNRHGVPLLGIYSGVEIAPFIGRSRGLDWTGVLMVLAERR